VSHRYIIALSVSLLLAACSSKDQTTSTTTTATAQQAGDFTIATQFSPDPPKQGAETITITLKDAAGNAVKGATVTIGTNMPGMSMAGPSLTASDNGDGTYSAQTNLNYATQWNFDIRAKAGAKTGKLAVKADVK
jgi:nitrogen fixation protein FixH